MRKNKVFGRLALPATRDAASLTTITHCDRRDRQKKASCPPGEACILEHPHLQDAQCPDNEGTENDTQPVWLTPVGKNSDQPTFLPHSISKTNLLIDT